jgi:hypothetical protein
MGRLVGPYTGSHGIVAECEDDATVRIAFQEKLVCPICACTAGLGIYAVFRNPQDAQDWLAEKIRRPVDWDTLSRKPRASPRRVERAEPAMSTRSQPYAGMPRISVTADGRTLYEMGPVKRYFRTMPALRKFFEPVASVKTGCRGRVGRRNGAISQRTRSGARTV